MRAVRGSAVRIAASYSLLFALSSAVLMILGVWWTTSAMLREVDAGIDADITRLSGQYRAAGMPGLVSAIRERLNTRQLIGDNLYLLVDETGAPIVGNLTRWPTERPDREGRITFVLGNIPDLDDTSRRARARIIRVGERMQLAVGRDLVYLDVLRARLIGGFGWGLGIVVLLALLGGVVVSRSANRRVATLNTAIDEVMRGDLARRLPLRGNDDEIDELIGHVNGMLDRIGELMTNVRQVSDNIAHDLRTPLTRLRRRLDEVAGASGLDGSQRAAIETASAEADGLLATFNALLRIARIEASDRRSGFTAVDLGPLLEDVVELYEPVAEDLERRLEREDLTGGVVIRGDRDLLFQAAANLVDNALKFTPPGGAVLVRLEEGPGGTVEIVVEDEGPGIPESERERVLRRFVRLDESRSTSGNGLGLALTDAVARLHGGAVLIEDADPGTRVRLRVASG